MAIPKYSAGDYVLHTSFGVCRIIRVIPDGYEIGGINLVSNMRVAWTRIVGLATPAQIIINVATTEKCKQMRERFKLDGTRTTQN